MAISRKARHFVLPEIVLDRKSGMAMHQQIRRQIAVALRTEKPGARLPSTRTLAQLLGVSRNTVLAAYEELVADGLIEGRHGSAMFVRATDQTGVVVLDATRLLREARYPVRTVTLLDPDGTPIYFTY